MDETIEKEAAQYRWLVVLHFIIEKSVNDGVNLAKVVFQGFIEMVISKKLSKICFILLNKS